MKMPLYSSSHVSQIQSLYPTQKLPAQYFMRPWTQAEYVRIKELEATPTPQKLPELNGFSAKLAHFYSSQRLSGKVLSLGAGISNIEIQCVKSSPTITQMYCVDLEPFMDQLPRLVDPEVAMKMKFIRASLFDEKLLLNLAAEGRFDAIMINQVIYALSDEDLHQLLNICEKLLVPGGSIFIMCSSLLSPRTGLLSFRRTLKILFGNRQFKPIGILRSASHLVKIYKDHSRFQVLPLKSEIPISYKLVLKA